MEMNSNIEIIRIDETGSTNSWLLEHPANDSDCIMRVVSAGFQTNGRGQKGNTWESEREKNLLFSIQCHPQFTDAGNQFCLSEAISMAIVDTLSETDDEIAENISVKWPNDIYWKNMKLAGILIENSIQGHCLSESIIGVGLNVNQQTFLSNAPNPISLANIIRRDTDRNSLLELIITRFFGYYSLLAEGRAAELHDKYMSHLFRRRGMYRYRDAGGEFMASIGHVDSNGILTLVDEEGRTRKYEFKQVSCIL